MEEVEDPAAHTDITRLEHSHSLALASCGHIFESSTQVHHTPLARHTAEKHILAALNYNGVQCKASLLAARGVDAQWYLEVLQQASFK